MVPNVTVALVLITILLVVSLWLNLRLWWSGRRKAQQASSQIRAASIDRGLIAEQFAPFTNAFQKLGWDAQEFKFLGKPVDGVQFEEDEVIIVEFKTGKSTLSQKQRRIKELVERGKVRFQEVRF